MLVAVRKAKTAAFAEILLAWGSGRDYDFASRTTGPVA